MDLTTKKVTEKKTTKMNRFWRSVKNQKMLYAMSLPFVAWVFVFNYLPVWGWTMAFQDFIPGKAFWEQDWIGFDHFIQLFQDERFFLALRNTLAMSFLGLLFGFTIPIVFAILLNEVRHSFFKRITQTVTYLPHFVSWVVVAGIVTKMLSTDGGIINDVLVGMGILDEPYQFMAEGQWFWAIVTISDIWKEMGWNAIIFLAAIAGLDPQLYEAAKVDGASRFRQIWHITLPGIRPTILVVLILNIGHLIQIGFEKQMLLSNSLVMEYAEVLELYALNYGIGLSQFSYGTAIGIFNSVVSIFLLLLANGIFKRYSNQSVM